MTPQREECAGLGDCNECGGTGRCPACADFDLGEDEKCSVCNGLDECHACDGAGIVRITKDIRNE